MEIPNKQTIKQNKIPYPKRSSENVPNHLNRRIYKPENGKGKFQTRSDDHRSKFSSIFHFDSLKEAIKASDEDSSIWKISWGEYIEKDGHKEWMQSRWRPKMKGDVWENGDQTLRQISDEYRNASNDTIFWVLQDVTPDEKYHVYEFFQERKIDDESEQDKIMLPLLIQAVLNQEEFRKLAE